ncbi:MAG: preprotein translocase subunit SecG [Acidimicrobiia bacterium]|nr:preprotein translocase subunit SecG [Acidimicrobiia bacterium]MDH5238436.1 preprotein translocase subunit SecG [Acidimicrobiia bacterium]
MLVLVTIVHVIVSMALIFLVLLHSGKGGGLSDMFGGGLGASAAGSTVVEQNLDRITIVVALVFSFNTIALALLL